MNYRRLRRDELEELRPQFVRFLAAQGIPGEEWARLTASDDARVDALVDRFSAMVFDDVLARARYLERRDAHRLLVYRCGEERLELRGLIVSGGAGEAGAAAGGVGEAGAAAAGAGEADAGDAGGEFDFRQNLPAAELLARLRASGAGLRLASAERAYARGRGAELFELLEAGARIAPNGELFDLLDGLGTDTPPSDR